MSDKKTEKQKKATTIRFKKSRLSSNSQTVPSVPSSGLWRVPIMWEGCLPAALAVLVEERFGYLVQVQNVLLKLPELIKYDNKNET